MQLIRHKILVFECQSNKTPKSLILKQKSKEIPAHYKAWTVTPLPFVSYLTDRYCLLLVETKINAIESFLTSHKYFNFPHQISLVETETKEKGTFFFHDTGILMAITYQSGY